MVRTSLIGPGANPKLLLAPVIPGCCVATQVKVDPAPVEAVRGTFSVTPLQVAVGKSVDTDGLGLTVTVNVVDVPTQPGADLGVTE